MKNLILLSILALVMASCAVKKDYKRSKEDDSIQQYNYFLMLHPDSKYAGEIRQRLEFKQEEEAWSKALYQNRSQEYKVFMNQYPKSRNYNEANRRYKITLEEESWANAEKKNTIDGYNEFIKSYQSSPNNKLALSRIEELTWEKARQTKDFAWYQNKYPDGIYAEDAIQQQDKYDWETAKNTRSVAAIDVYLIKHKTGLYSQDAEKLKKEVAEEDFWYSTNKEGTIASYRAYLNTYKKGKYATKAQQEINKIQVMESDWSEAKKKNTIAAYRSFLSDYPYSNNKIEAERRINAIEQDAWNKTKQKNTIVAYRSFLSEYPYSSNKNEAERRIIVIEQDAWNKAKQKNTIAGYRQFIDAYPESEYSQQAEEKIIDLEVAAVFAGDHGQLPPMQKTSFGRNYASNDISIKNDTPYTLTVLYSGPESERVVIRSGASTSINLSNGYYRIAAKVNATNVIPYAGTENLSGGEYTSSFYISTSTYRY